MGKYRISVCMGTKNEEKAVGSVIENIYSVLGKDTEIVITDSSKDRTPEIAEKLGARVLRQPPMGYGVALRAALLAATGDVIVTADCDGSYPMEAVPQMLKMLEKYDVVSGSRILGKSRVASMPFFNEFGNRMFALIVNVLFGSNFTDVSTGQRAFKREVIRSTEWTENIGLSLELVIRPHALGFRIGEIPIDYKERIGDTKLNPIKGGWEMLKSIVRLRLGKIRRLRS